MVFRRRSLPPSLTEPFERFRALIPALERAKVALTASIPSTRLPGRPLAETLLEFEDGLREVRGGMDSWRTPDVEDAWLRASVGLEEAMALAASIRSQAPGLQGFEQLIGLIGDLIQPLESFSAAADRFRELRT